MEPVIKTYIIDARQFENETAFNAALNNVSPYRRQKVALLKNYKDKNRALAAAVALNTALAEYGLKERDMEYNTGKHGKPYFRYNPGLNFSLSHSGAYALCSIGPGEVGADIERVREGKEKVAERFFAKEELDWINAAVEPEVRTDRIFRIWTMKEGFLKATGFGMSLPLKEFAVIAEKNEKFQIRQYINDITYHIKEYAIPEIFGENNGYKISVCSEAAEFADRLEVV